MGSRTRSSRSSGFQGIRDRDATVQIVQAQLQAVGMKVELNPLEAGPLVDNHKNRTFDLSLYGGGLYTIDGDSTSVPNQCDQAYPAGGNNAHYCNADVDAAFAEGAPRATTRSATRRTSRWRGSRTTRCRTSGCTCRQPSGRTPRKLQNFKPHGELTYGFWNRREWNCLARL